ncbi:MAG: hypothetical protein AB7H66_16815 [Hyphomonadaceae bacterium]
MDADAARGADLVMRARWKYVCYADADGHEVLETFEPSTLHAAYVSEEGIDRGRLISAGFATADGECYGVSTSLNLPSRPLADTALLRMLLG